MLSRVAVQQRRSSLLLGLVFEAEDPINVAGTVDDAENEVPGSGKSECIHTRRPR
jgi:hypothetical protein